MMSLLYHLLDEFLFLFSAEPFFIARVSHRISVLHNSVITGIIDTSLCSYTRK